ncbi:hypothetical protein DXG01_007858 [Tephrocybe rancida]|nr:hypothetical protein DXG01_007858 [Tephrocybe rancida]
MAEQAEQAFIRTFLNTLSTQRVVYPDSYQQPPTNSLKRVPVLPIAVPPVPKRVSQPAAGSSTSQSASPLLSITFKSLKPPISFTIPVKPTDTITAIKAQLAAEPHAPPADAQRFLLKGKALADTKLLQEYYLKDKDTVTVVVKPGTVWDPPKSPIPSPPPPPPPPQEQGTMPNESLVSPTPRRGHQRIPSVLFSPSPSGESELKEKDILLTLDNTNPANVSVESLSTYGATVAQPEFWKRLYEFLKSEFASPTDALTAWEDYFRASKGSLATTQIAKIRDEVGIVGMSGT